MGNRSNNPTVLKLPTVMPDGKRTKLHPLVWCVANLKLDTPKTRLAKHMGTKPQSLYKWLRMCREDRNFSLPLERAVQIGKYYDVPVSLFRPDVYPALKEAA